MSAPPVSFRSSAIAALSLLAIVGVSQTNACADAVDDQLAVVAATGPEGRGSSAARKACDALAQHSPEILPRVLAAMDAPNPVAANWLRTVFDDVTDRALARPRSAFAVDELQAFVKDPRHAGRPRRLAVALVDRLEPKFRATWLLSQLDDPEFRADAVGIALAAAERALAAGDHAHALVEARKAFDHAREAEQITAAAALLERLGKPASARERLGFVTRWHLIGPFAAPGKSGFAKVFPPEQNVDLAATYAEGEARRAWSVYETRDPLGQFDLTGPLGAAAEAVAYAYAELDSPRKQAAELRCSADDNLTVWLNGQKVFARQQWQNGARLDRFIAPVTLVAGANRVLVKICQGPPSRDPESINDWTFLLRFCDSTGIGIPLVNKTPASKAP